MRGRWTIACAMAWAIGASACYQGLGGPDGADSGADGDTDSADGEGADDAPDAACEQSSGYALRRLTTVQYANALQDVFDIEVESIASFLPDDRIGPFATNSAVAITELGVEKYHQAAEEVGEAIEANPAKFGNCGDDRDCAEAYLVEVGRRLYRRSLDDGEIARLMERYDGAAQDDGGVRGLSLAVQSLLMSPNFLYVLEFGKEDDDPAERRLTDLELATRLSLLLWNRGPDDALLTRAEAGELGDPEALEAEVDRLLADPRARDGFLSFHVQWLGLPELDEVTKDPELFAEFTPEVQDAMQDDLVAFLDHVVFESEGTLTELLTADYGFPSAALGPIYGPSEADGDGKVVFGDGQRSGVLTHPALMSIYAHDDRTSPVHRGKWVRERFLCQLLPPPPPDVNDVLPDPDPSVNEQDLLRQHRENPECAPCHDLIDPVGFAFEHYDAIGRWRDKAGEFDIDASGELIGTDVDGPIDGVPGLAERLLQSELVDRCYVRNWLIYALGRAADESLDGCAIDALSESFTAQGGDVRALVLEIVRSRAFRSISIDVEEGT